MTDPQHVIQQLLARYRQRLRLRRVSTGVAAVGCLALLLWRLARIGMAPAWLTALAVAGLAGVGSWQLWLAKGTRHTGLSAARDLDRVLALQERLTTAEQFSRSTTPPLLYGELLKSTEQSLEMAQARLPRWYDRTGIALAVLLLLLLLWPQPRASMQRLAQKPPEASPRSSAESKSSEPDRTEPSEQSSSRDQQRSSSQPQPSGTGQPSQGQQGSGAGGQSGRSQASQGGQAGQQSGQSGTSNSDQGQSPSQSSGMNPSQGQSGQGQPQTSAGGTPQGQGSAKGTTQAAAGQKQTGTAQQAAANAAADRGGQSASKTGATPTGAAQQTAKQNGQASGKANQSGAGATGQQRAASGEGNHQDQGQQANQRRDTGQGQQGSGTEKQLAEAQQGASNRPGESGGAGPTPSQEALKADIKQLLKNLSGELKELQAQQLQNLPAQVSNPAPGLSTDPQLYGDPMALERATGAAMPIQLEADTEATSAARRGGGLGQPSGHISQAAPQQQSEDATLSEQQTEEQGVQRQAVPPEYRPVFERLAPTGHQRS